MDFLMDVDELEKKMSSNADDLVVIDVRFDLGNPYAGRSLYLESHIPEAIYLDLNKDLSGRVQKHGGNHPLPNMEEFVGKLEDVGVSNQTTVVIYDQENGMFAARMWWLLYYIGHEDMYMLDGGFKEWSNKGKKITNDIPNLNRTKYYPNFRTEEIVDIKIVKDKLKNQEAVLIDSRAKERYLGKAEPLYEKAGHIPKAKNFFWKHVLNEDGTWKSADELNKHFENFNKDEEIIVSCGSGVSACPNVIALKTIGFTNVKLYPGSYSDWISYPENEIETREE